MPWMFSDSLARNSVPKNGVVSFVSWAPWAVADWKPASDAYAVPPQE